jgi:hypothetical protein
MKLPQILSQWLLCLLLSVCCICAVMVALHLPGWLAAIDNMQERGQRAIGSLEAGAANLPATMASVRESADTANDVSTESLDLVGSMNKLVDAAGKTSAKLDSAVDSTRYDVDTMAEKLDTAIDAYATIPAHLNGVSDAVPPTLYAIEGLTTDVRKFVNDPVTADTRDNLNALFLNSATIVKHTDTWLFPPKYTGKHPFWHGMGQAGKYGLKVAPGIAGGIAIARGN